MEESNFAYRKLHRLEAPILSLEPRRSTPFLLNPVDSVLRRAHGAPFVPQQEQIIAAALTGDTKPDFRALQKRYFPYRTLIAIQTKASRIKYSGVDFTRRNKSRGGEEPSSDSDDASFIHIEEHPHVIIEEPRIFDEISSLNPVMPVMPVTPVRQSVFVPFYLL
jgi:hypothetical protein